MDTYAEYFPYGGLCPSFCMFVCMICVCVCVCARAGVCVCVCMRVLVSLFVCLFVFRVCIYIYIYIYIYMCLYYTYVLGLVHACVVVLVAHSMQSQGLLQRLKLSKVHLCLDSADCCGLRELCG